MFDHKDYRQGIWISNLTCTYFSNGRFQKQHQRPAVFVQKTYGRPAKLCRQSCFLSKSSSLDFGVFSVDVFSVGLGDLSRICGTCCLKSVIQKFIKKQGRDSRLHKGKKIIRTT